MRRFSKEDLDTITTYTGITSAVCLGAASAITSVLSAIPGDHILGISKVPFTVAITVLGEVAAIAIAIQGVFTNKTATKHPTTSDLENKASAIEQLNLDSDTQSILEKAIGHSGMASENFIKQAVKVYAKTITGKAKQTSEDLSNVPTTKLLNDSKYKTHPARAEELTKRAIRAIKIFNSNKATENADRWCITQNAIASLTGSRQSSIKQILFQFKDDIETHNQTYGLNGYSNRKPGHDIAEDIKLAELVPDGVD